MLNEIDALTSEIRATTGFLSILISKKLGVVMIVGVCMGVILKVLFY